MLGDMRGEAVSPTSRGLVLVVALLLALFVRGEYDVVSTGLNWTAVAPTQESGTHRHTLCSISIMKNEGEILDEWVRHYIWQGVDHMYVIDNNSTDNTMEVLQSHITSGRVSYFLRPERHRQTTHYNEVYQRHARAQCAWLLLVDADEYAYHRHQGSTLRAYVRRLDARRVVWVHMRWRMFGSSGHVQQPPSIRTSFLWRGARPTGNGGKLIANTRFAASLDIHHVNVDPPGLPGSKHVNPSLHPSLTASILGGARMVFIVEPAELALNHYAVMSLEYFQRHKMTRGSADGPQKERARTMAYFRNYDVREAMDFDLATLVNGTSGSSGQG